MSSKAFIKLVCVVASLLLFGAQASARTIHASAGVPVFLGSRAHPAQGWVISNTVSYSPSDINQHGDFAVPIIFDNPGARSVTVRGKRDAGEILQCVVIAYKIDGTVASSSGTLIFPATGVLTQVTGTLNSVPAGATGRVTCLFGRNADLLDIDYLP